MLVASTSSTSHTRGQLDTMGKRESLSSLGGGEAITTIKLVLQ